MNFGDLRVPILCGLVYSSGLPLRSACLGDRAQDSGLWISPNLHIRWSKRALHSVTECYRAAALEHNARNLLVQTRHEANSSTDSVLR